MAQTLEDQGIEHVENLMALREDQRDLLRAIARLTDEPKIIALVVAGKKKLDREKPIHIAIHTLFAKRKTKKQPNED